LWRTGVSSGSKGGLGPHKWPSECLLFIPWVASYQLFDVISLRQGDVGLDRVAILRRFEEGRADGPFYLKLLDLDRGVFGLRVPRKWFVFGSVY
jgi:hypothetical protein